MSIDFTVIEKRLQQIDISKLIGFDQSIRQIASLNPAMSGIFMQKFIIAQEIAGTLYATAIKHEISLKKKLEEVEAIAYLDKASEYLKSHGIKESSEARKRYIPLDEDVKRVQDLHAKVTALVKLLQIKLGVYRQCHDDVKKLAYGNDNTGII